MKKFLAIAIFCWSVTGFATGHDNEDARREAIYPFKQQAYDLCSGHGLMHLNDEEMRELCVRLANNLDDVRALLKNPRHDIFLSNLTGLIIRSPVPEEVKRELLRESYEISKEKSSEGDEWHFTIVRLIEETDVLSLDEVASHIYSKDIRLRGAATRFIEKNAGEESIRPERRPDESEPDELPPDPEIGSLGAESSSEIEQTSGGLYWFIGVCVFAILGLGFIVLRKKSA